MKKLSTLFIILLGVFSIVTSCKDNDDPIPTLDGKWVLVKAEVTTTDNNGVVANQFTIPVSQFAEKDKLELEFSNGKIITQVDASGNAVVTSLNYRIDNNTLLVKYDDTSAEDIFAMYTLNSNTDLSLTFVELSDDGKIETKLTYKRK